MEQFVVSARKYRPALFETVVGQEHVTGTLKNAIRNNHLASAFLFTGPRGVGKTTCARILARTINCEQLDENLHPCGKCAPCRTFDEGHSLNVFELDAASNNSVDDIRNLILQVQIAPQVGTRKVYIIDEVHMLSSAAFNAFLKTLEEPPSYAIFILATTEKHKVLPTILSRCQVFDFRRITTQDMAQHLAGIATKEGISAEPQALHVIAEKADGGLRDALSIFDQLVSFAGKELTLKAVQENLNVLDHEHYFTVTDQLMTGDSAGALVAFHGILAQGFDGHLFAAGLAKHLRNLLMAQDARTIPLLEVGPELGGRYAAQAKAMPRDLLVRCLAKLGQVDVEYKQSKEPRLLVELALIVLAHHAGAEKKSPDVTGTAVPPPSAAPVPPAPSPSAPLPQPPAASIPPPAASAPPPAAAVRPAEPPPPSMPPPPRPAGAPARRVAGGISIKEQLDRSATTAAPPAPAAPRISDLPGTEPAASIRTGTAAPLNASLLLKVWTDYALARKAEGKVSMHATLLAREPVISDPHTVTFTIVNDVQENYLREEKHLLLGHLRREVGDPDLDLIVEKEVVTDMRPRYTPRDRFSIMADRNPVLHELRDALDLDLS